jgi:hypothetical protein
LESQHHPDGGGDTGVPPLWVCLGGMRKLQHG